MLQWLNKKRPQCILFQFQRGHWSLPAAISSKCTWANRDREGNVSIAPFWFTSLHIAGTESCTGQTLSTTKLYHPDDHHHDDHDDGLVRHFVACQWEQIFSFGMMNGPRCSAARVHKSLILSQPTFIQWWMNGKSNRREREKTCRVRTVQRWSAFLFCCCLVSLGPRRGPLEPMTPSTCMHTRTGETVIKFTLLVHDSPS